MTSSTDFAKNIRIVATVPNSVAVLCTILRLYYRYSRKHLGLDDAWAFLALIAAFFMVAGAWLHSFQATESRYHLIMGYYMTSGCFTCVLWWARISILFSVVRIIPYLMVLRKWSYACVAWFFAMWAVMIIQKTYVCERDTTWKTLPGVQCVLGKSVAGVELFTDITADIILVALPLRLLWGIGIGSSRRKLLMAIFSASAITTIVSIVHSVFVFSPDRDGEAYMAHVEAATALTICNLAVLVTWGVRVFVNGEDLESVGVSVGSDYLRRRSGQNTTQLTTIRFDKDTTIRYDKDPAIVLRTMDDGGSQETRTDFAKAKGTDIVQTTSFTADAFAQHPKDFDAKDPHDGPWLAR